LDDETEEKSFITGEKDGRKDWWTANGLRNEVKISAKRDNAVHFEFYFAQYLLPICQ